MSDKAKTQLLLKRTATSRPRKRWGPGDQRAAGEDCVLKYSQERVRYGLFVADVPWRTL